jgi:hypothetical protein
MKTVTITTIVVDCTSARDGVITLRISLRTSFRKSISRCGLRLQPLHPGALLVCYCNRLRHDCCLKLRAA